MNLSKMPCFLRRRACPFAPPGFAPPDAEESAKLDADAIAAKLGIGLTRVESSAAAAPAAAEAPAAVEVPPELQKRLSCHV